MPDGHILRPLTDVIALPITTPTPIFVQINSGSFHSYQWGFKALHLLPTKIGHKEFQPRRPYQEWALHYAVTAKTLFLFYHPGPPRLLVSTL